MARGGPSIRAQQTGWTSSPLHLGAKPARRTTAAACAQRYTRIFSVSPLPRRLASSLSSRQPARPGSRLGDVDVDRASLCSLYRRLPLWPSARLASSVEATPTPRYGTMERCRLPPVPRECLESSRSPAHFGRHKCTAGRWRGLALVSRPG